MTLSYNSLHQLTSLTQNSQTITYTYPAGTNNGKISSQTISGEQIQYLYDSLNRLSSAAGSGWGQTFSYDGFGNLTNRVPSGTAPSSPAAPGDPATNRLTGYTYDNNGNAYLSGGQYYDAENRLIETNNSDTSYGDDSRNKRIWEGTYTYNGNGGYNQTAAQVFFDGLDGKKLGTYTPSVVYGGQGGVVPQSIAFGGTTNTYFAGRMVQQSGGTFIEDRLGSNGKYFPYGEERNYPALPNDQVKFETYTRDSATGLDYADQRYYSSVLGRFLTPDPSKASRSPVGPQSLNRNSYAWSDPINMLDPRGLYPCGSSTSVNGGVISVTVYDCVGLLFPDGPAGLIGLYKPVYTVTESDDTKGILPKCPIVPSLPGNSNPASQIQANIGAALDEFERSSKYTSR